MRLLTTIIITLLCLSAGAQQTFTQRLQDNANRRGRITLHQNDALTALVNGMQNTESTPDTELNATDNAQDDQGSILLRRGGTRVNMQGYRIQIYAGGHSRISREQAEQAKQRARQLVPDETIYTRYISPRWVCRVGDYRSYEEAYEAMRRLQVVGGFPDAVIVKSRVQVLID